MLLTNQGKDGDLTTRMDNMEVTGEPDRCGFCGVMEAKYGFD